MRDIINLKTKERFEISANRSGENHMPCPACSQDHPKSSKKKCFSWNDQKKTGICHRCESSFVEYKPMTEKKETYVLPTFNDKTELSEAHLKWFQGRMISNEALKKGRVYTSKEFMPQLEKEVSVACFPFYRDGVLINIKYRGPQKSFKLSKGAEKIFYNWDLAKDSPTVVIVEGEIDALSYLTCGINFVISVPNGANKNLDYLDDCIDHFELFETVILAVDQDPKGLELQKELARRIGPEKCKLVDFKGCKDANEYLVQNGAPELFKTLDDSRDYPIGGVFTVMDFEEQFDSLYYGGLKSGVEIGIKDMDKSITWEVGRLVVVTGVPGHGKSELVDFIICKLNHLHGWKCGVFSPENHPIELHLAKLSEKFIGKPFGSAHMSADEYGSAKRYLNKNFFTIAPEEDLTIDSILSKAKYLVKKYGIKVLVIDPYNRLEHQYDGSTETKYISVFLDSLTNFARLYGVLVFLVAHPVKMPKENGMMAVPTLYSINGSANFYNKTDYGLTAYRKVQDGLLSNELEVHVQKVKFKHLGRPSLVEVAYNDRNGRFEGASVDGINGWDNSNWLEPKRTDIPSDLITNYGPRHETVPF